MDENESMEAAALLSPRVKRHTARTDLKRLEEEIFMGRNG
jgi:hypothetical protein